MTRRKPRRASWSQELRAQAIADARVHGSRAASERFDVPLGTIASWISRSDNAPAESHNVEDAALEAEATRFERTEPAALTVREWITLQRHAERRLRSELRSGSASSARFASVALAVVSDKLALARREPVAESSDAAMAEAMSRAQVALEQLDRSPRNPQRQIERLEGEVKERDALIQGLRSELRAARTEPAQRALPAPKVEVVEVTETVAVVASVERKVTPPPTWWPNQSVQERIGGRPT